MKIFKVGKKDYSLHRIDEIEYYFNRYDSLRSYQQWHTFTMFKNKLEKICSFEKKINFRYYVDEDRLIIMYFYGECLMADAVVVYCHEFKMTIEDFLKQLNPVDLYWIREGF